jgi:hypothetical protein
LAQEEVQNNHGDDERQESDKAKGPERIEDTLIQIPSDEQLS